MPVSDPAIRVGTVIRYALRLRGLPLRWTSLIAVWEPPSRFVDEQLRGPYRLWVHTHGFEDLGATTRVSDHVRYAPLGGWLADRLLVRRDMAHSFERRARRLTGLFPPPERRPGPTAPGTRRSRQ